MKMANYIYSIIKRNRMVMWSWGFQNPSALANDEGLKFKVNGFIHKGFVKVVYNGGQDLFGNSIEGKTNIGVHEF